MKTLTSPGQLCWQARAVISLWRIGLSLAEIADIYKCEQSDISRFFKRLTNNNHPVLRTAFHVGIPAHSAVNLPNQKSVRCDRCGILLCVVPCVSCTIRQRGRLDIRTQEQRPPKTPRRSTTHHPGTTGKLNTMRRRVQRGESVFHKDDAKGVIA